METPTKDENKRGRLLSIWLILNVLLNIVIAYLFASTLLGSTQTSSPPLNNTDQWAGIVLAVTSIISIAAILGIWRWRKIGLYIFIALALPAFIAYLALNTRILTAIFPLTSATLMWTLIKPKWEYFY